MSLAVTDCTEGPGPRTVPARRVLVRALGLLAVFTLAAGPHAATTPGVRPLVIRDVAVVDVETGAVRPGQTVVCEAGHVTTVGAADRTSVPRGAFVIDGRGAYAIPGFWDMHVHLSWTGETALAALVANGVTGVRDMGGRLGELDAWQVRIADGRLAGPVIVRAGPTLNGQAFAWHHLEVKTADQAAAAVRTLHAVGVDFVKMHRAISREAYLAMAAEAKRLSLPFAGHVPLELAREEAVDAGQASIEHIETLIEGPLLTSVPLEQWLATVARWREAGAPALFARMAKQGTAMTPTLVAYRAATDLRLEPDRADPRDRYLAPAVRERAREYAKPVPAAVLEGRVRIFDEFARLVAAMRDAGVPILAGTDIAGPRVYPGFSLHDELALLVEAGLTPLEALQAATRNAARALGRLDDTGTVASGKRADLVLLDASPLDDIEHVRQIRGVVAGGRWFDRGTLDGLLEGVAAANARR